MLVHPAGERPGDFVKLGLFAEVKHPIAVPLDPLTEGDVDAMAGTVVVGRGYIHVHAALDQAAGDEREGETGTAMLEGERWDHVQNLEPNSAWSGGAGGGWNWKPARQNLFVEILQRSAH